MSIFFVISGVGQALSGFVVDRIGARPVLFAAIACFLMASLAASQATGYGGWCWWPCWPDWATHRFIRPTSPS
jgi:MFS family permease